MILLKEVRKTFNENRQDRIDSLQEINIHVKAKELVVLKGVSGSGKSTLLSIIASLNRPSFGEVIVDGISIAKLPDDFSAEFRRDHIGMIFQKFNLIDEMSAIDNVTLPLIPTSIPTDILEEKAKNILAAFGINKRLSSPVKNLSGGEQQRVAIARSLINDPKIILADEPTANLDRKLTHDFIDILKELKKSGKTIIIATHDPLFFELGIVDRIIEIKDGRIV